MKKGTRCEDCYPVLFNLLCSVILFHFISCIQRCSSLGNNTNALLYYAVIAFLSNLLSPRPVGVSTWSYIEFLQFLSVGSYNVQTEIVVTVIASENNPSTFR